MSKLLKCKSELEYIKLSNENISLELANTELKDILAKKKDELMRVRDDLLSAQKAVIEKDSTLQETNSLLLEHISKTSSESKQNEAIGGDKGLEKGNKISSPKITSESSYSSFFQHAIIFTIVLLIIYFLWCIFSYLYSFISLINEEKNLLNYKIPINRNYSYGFSI
ncbi:hypothetical protein RirG_183550 [Rhizophagus irregularis DAOM 197198w]|uniref:Uncharacterized protein n=1 Tax=Rhizophagus irregularis (strain DAOM 197198w) TaxID=1432141 RepID=A0A015KK21_RHIIW|nr:hypothetical protein RirG_183550 [Rhizophagus irregularis DAOM 197198w]